MRPLAFAALAVAAFAAVPGAQAQPRPPGGGVVVGPGGGTWVGGGYRPWYGPGYGYGRWGWGYPGIGFGYGVGWGYGAGWALAASSPWYWGSPAVVYTAPAFYPYGYAASPLPTFQLETDVRYVQQAAPAADATPAPPPATPQQAAAPAGFWYYCTEPAGYHPYVAQCSRPWIAVNPQSLPPSGAAPAH